jgi:hypothetical protein
MSGRSGWASRPRRDPPPHAIPPAAGHSPARGPSWFGLRPPTFPHSDRHARGPHAQAQWLLWPAGRSQPPTLRLETLKPGMRTSCPTTSRACGPRAGVGVSSARRVRRPSLRRPRGPQRTEPGWGVGDAVVCGHRGAPPRAALLGRGRRSLGAMRSRLRRESKRREAAYPLGNRKPHAVKQKKATAHGPRGKGKPRSERRSRLRQLTTPCCLATATKASTALFRSSRV